MDKEYNADSMKRQRRLVLRGESMPVNNMGRKVHGRVVTRQGVPRMVEACKEAARRTHSAFFDLYSAVGGEGTMRRWSQADPRLVSGDLGHLLNPGAQAVGTIISTALVSAYREAMAHQVE